MGEVLKTMKAPLKEAAALGQSIWYDGLATTDEFRRMIDKDGLRGVTTNPSIFEKSLSAPRSGSKPSQPEGNSPQEKYKSLTIEAIQTLADVFIPVYEKTRHQDGFVSIEVSPLLANDTVGTLAEARELHKRVGRNNVLIKVPATEEGVPAIETLIAEGISVNVTLIFSVKRYEEVIEAYLSGLERRVASNKPLSGIASVASFFVSRVDTETDLLLETKIKQSPGSGVARVCQSLLGRIAIANSKIAYKSFQEKFCSASFHALKAKGASLQRPLWASTSTKNPAYRDTLYVDTLIGPDTVNTLPPATFSAFKDHGVVASTLTQGIPQAAKDLEMLEQVGISLGDVTRRLEEAGVKLFADAYRKTIQAIASQMK